MSKLERIDKIERNFGVDQYGRQELDTMVMLKLTKNASKEDVRISKNFKLSMFKEAEKLKEEERYWRKQQTGHQSPRSDSNSMVNIAVQSKNIERGDNSARENSALVDQRSPSQKSLLLGGEDSSVYQTMDHATNSPSIEF